MFILIAPIVATGWPALAPIAMLAAGLMGFSVLTESSNKNLLRGDLTNKLLRKNKHRRTVAIPIHQFIKDNVAIEVDREERLEFVKGDLKLVFRKDARGQFFAEVEGPDTLTSKELQYMIDEFARNIIQQFSYNKIVKELEARGVNIVEEEINEQGEIVLQTRKWE